MKYKTKTINQIELRKELIDIYKKYTTNKRLESIEKAQKLDGVWSGNFLLNEDVEVAINNLTYFYVEPILKNERAKEILNSLLEND